MRFAPAIVVLFMLAGTGSVFVVRDAPSPIVAVGIVASLLLIPIAVTTAMMWTVRRARPRPAWTAEFLYPDRIVAHDASGAVGVFPLLEPGVRVERRKDRVAVPGRSWRRGANASGTILEGLIEAEIVELRCGDGPGPGVVLASTVTSSSAVPNTLMKPSEDLSSIVDVLRRSPHRDGRTAADEIAALAAA